MKASSGSGRNPGLVTITFEVASISTARIDSFAKYINDTINPLTELTFNVTPASAAAIDSFANKLETSLTAALINAVKTATSNLPTTGSGGGGGGSGGGNNGGGLTDRQIHIGNQFRHILNQVVDLQIKERAVLNDTTNNLETRRAHLERRIRDILSAPLSDKQDTFYTSTYLQKIQDAYTNVKDSITGVRLQEAEMIDGQAVLGEKGAAAIDRWRQKLADLQTYYTQNKTAISENTRLYTQFQQVMHHTPAPTTTRDANQRIAEINNLTRAAQRYMRTAVASEQAIEAARKSNDNQLNRLAQAYQNHSALLTRNKNLAAQYASMIDRIQNPTKAMLTKDGAAAVKKQVDTLISATDALEKKTGRIGKWLQSSIIGRLKHLVGAYSFTGIYRSLRFVLQSVRDIDKAMTQLKIITQQSDAAYAAFGETAAKVARQTGQSISDVIESSVVWARLGYSLNESAELSRAGAIFSNVAGVSTSEATTSLTSVLKAYDYQASEAIHIVDILTEVGQKYAISASELGVALEKGGAALATAGNTLEESAALMAAGNAAVQNAETVGTALKTTTLRVAGSKAELEAMGEEIDELASSTSKMREEIMQLSGVDIMKDATTYKSTYEILKEIAAVWNQIDNISQMALLEDLAGKRNASVIASVIHNIGDLEGAYDAASNSAGVAERANAVYMDSIEGRLGELSATAQNFATNFMSSDFMKALVSVGTLILDILDGLAQIGALGPMLVGVIASVVTIKTHLHNIAIQRATINQLAAVGPLTNKTEQQYAMILGAVNKQMRERVMNELNLTNAQKARLTGMMAMPNQITTGNAVDMMLSSGLAGSRSSARNILGFTNTRLYSNDAALSMADRARVAAQLKQLPQSAETDKLIASLEGTAPAAKRASVGIAGFVSKAALAVTVITTVVGLIRSLIKTHEDYVKEYQSALQAMEKANEKEKKLEDELAELYKRRQEINALSKNQRSVQDYQDLNTSEARIKEIKAEQAQLKKEQEILQQTLDVKTLNAYGEGFIKIDVMLGWLDDAETPAQKLGLLTEALEAYTSANWKYVAGATDARQQMINQTIAAAELARAQVLVESGADGAYNTLLDALVKYGKLSKDTIKQIAADGAASNEDLGSTFKDVIELLEDYGVEIKDDAALTDLFAAYLNKVKQEANEAAAELNDVNNKIKDFDTLVSQVRDPVEVLQKAEKEMAENGRLTLDTYLKLRELKLEDYVTKIADGYVLANGALQDYIKTQRRSLEATRDEAKAQLEAARSYTKSTAMIIAAKYTMKVAYADGGGREGPSDTDIKRTFDNVFNSLLGSAESAYNKAQQALDDFDQIVGSLTGAGRSPSSSSSNDDPFLKQWEDVNAAMKHEVEMGKRTQASYMEWLRTTTTRGVAGSYLNVSEETYQKYYEKIRSVQEEVRKYDLEQLDKQKDAFESLVDFRIKQLEEETKKQKEELDKRKENLEDFYDKQIELLEEQFDEEDYLEEQAEKREELANMRRQMDMLERDDSAWAKKRLAELKDEYAEAEEDYRKWERDHARDAVKKTLEDERDAAIKEIEDSLEVLDKQAEDEAAIRKQAIDDILSGNKSIMQAMEEFSIKQGTWLEDNIVAKWELAYKAVQKYGKGAAAIAALDNMFGVDRLDNETYRVLREILGGEYQQHAAGTPNAHGGWAVTQENGPEAILRRAGGLFTLLNPGDKVLNADATNFLYAFANNPGAILASSMSSLLSRNALTPAFAGMNNNSTMNIDMGDVIIQGNADEKTVSEFRREKRKLVNDLLQEFKKLR